MCYYCFLLFTAPSSRSKRSLKDKDYSKNDRDEKRGNDENESPSGVSDDFEVTYDASIDAGADVFFSTVGAAAFHAAIPPTVRIVSENYIPVQEVSVCMRVLVYFHEAG